MPTTEPSRPGAWMLVCVICRDATNEAEAKQMCKESVAYRGNPAQIPEHRVGAGVCQDA